mmetsp:Transcript_8035/g.17496  ORF Transcript_8035/g.17496 Transcript_8035/m.17496 type:complete len:123 (-) Transcript_8035:357-725(-)
MDNYMQTNFNNSSVNLNAAVFNFSGKESDVNCADLNTHLNFDNMQSFNATITQLEKMGSSLGTFAACGNFRKTVQIKGKFDRLFLVNKANVIKEQQFDRKTFKILKDYYFHARISPSFRFVD